MAKRMSKRGRKPKPRNKSRKAAMRYPKGGRMF